MQYQLLRGTGITVSRVCLGTMTFGHQADEAASVRMLEMALDAGVNFVDEADVYVGGRSEEILGRALKGRRHRLVLASKVCNFVGEDRRKDAGLHRWHVIRGVEASLRRLQTDCLDLCYLHKPDPNTPIEETLAALDTLVQQGKVIYLGMSNFASWQVCEALWRCDVKRWSPPAVMQVPYNLITRSLDEECVAFSQRMSLGIVVYNPLAGGLLTGKHVGTDNPEKGTRFELNRDYYGRYWNEVNHAAVESLRQLAEEAGKTMTQLSLQWLMAQAHVDSVILGASRPEQLEENLRSLDGGLDQGTLEACDAVWRRVRGDHFAYNR